MKKFDTIIYFHIVWAGNMTLKNILKNNIIKNNSDIKIMDISIDE